MGKGVRERRRGGRLVGLYCVGFCKESGVFWGFAGGG